MLKFYLLYQNILRPKVPTFQQSISRAEITQNPQHKQKQNQNQIRIRSGSENQNLPNTQASLRSGPATMPVAPIKEGAEGRYFQQPS